MAHAPSIECFFLNKSTSYLSLCVSLNSFCNETSRTWASLSPESRCVISAGRLSPSMCARMLSCSVMSDTLWPRGLWLARLLCPWNFPGKNTGVGFHFLLQGIFPPRGQIHVSFTSKHILYHCASWEAPRAGSSPNLSCTVSERDWHICRRQRRIKPQHTRKWSGDDGTVEEEKFSMVGDKYILMMARMIFLR